MTSLSNVKLAAVRFHAAAAVLLLTLFICSCKVEEPNPNAPPAAPERLTSFAQDITSPVRTFQVDAGGIYPLDLTIKNTSSESWPGGKKPMSVDVGYRWLDINGAALPIEGNRAVFTRPVLRPSESDSVKLLVAAPPTPGTYTLKISAVQEGYVWFHDRGAQPLILEVTVKKPG